MQFVEENFLDLMLSLSNQKVVFEVTQKSKVRVTLRINFSSIKGVCQSVVPTKRQDFENKKNIHLLCPKIIYTYMYTNIYFIENAISNVIPNGFQNFLKQIEPYYVSYLSTLANIC